MSQNHVRMKRMLALCTAAATLATSGCGIYGGSSDPSAGQGISSKSSQSHSSQPVNTELQQRMNIYKEIKKYEYSQEEQQLKEEKKQYKKMLHERKSLFKRELDLLEQERRGKLYFNKKQAGNRSTTES